MKDLFIKLIKIASPSGQEKPVRDFLETYFKQLGTKTSKYKGNLMINLPGKGKTILLTAHMDTVQKVGEFVKPNIDNNGIIKSDGKTILGADNKAGVAILLKVAEAIIKLKTHSNLWFAFTANEEAGRMTSIDLPVEKLGAELILNIDGGKVPGTVDIEALGQVVFEIDVLGKSAHAAVEPEKGINALIAAAELISLIKIGKKQNGDTLNIGMINSDGVTNVVPDRVWMKGEIRSFTKLGINNALLYIHLCFKKVEQNHGVKMRLKILKNQGTPVWEKTSSNNWRDLLRAAALKSNLVYKEDKMYACSDANPLALSGVPTYSINRGGKDSHSNKESITVQEMEDTKRFIIAILEQI